MSRNEHFSSKKLLNDSHGTNYNCLTDDFDIIWHKTSSIVGFFWSATRMINFLKVEQVHVHVVHAHVDFIARHFR